MYLIIHRDDLLVPPGERRNVATGEEPMSDDQWYEFCHYAGCHFPVVMVVSTAPTVSIREDVRTF
jgi:hypothetical protein